MSLGAASPVTTSMLLQLLRGASPSLPSAPFIPEIEAAHAAACRSGSATYADPSTGYAVFTRASHLSRGVCCGSGCRHCPFGGFTPRVTTAPRAPLSGSLLLRRAAMRGGKAPPPPPPAVAALLLAGRGSTACAWLSSLAAAGSVSATYQLLVVPYDASNQKLVRVAGDEAANDYSSVISSKSSGSSSSSLPALNGAFDVAHAVQMDILALDMTSADVGVSTNTVTLQAISEAAAAVLHRRIEVVASSSTAVRGLASPLADSPLLLYVPQPAAAACS